MSRNWVAVASADHVRIGRSGGFMQLGHGKAAPLRRLKPGDRVVYYSPTDAFRGTHKLQAFTALGVVKQRSPYQVDTAGGVRPYRRDVDWCIAEETPIAGILDRLDFANKRNWGYQLRFGLFEISERDMFRIAQAMHAVLS
jgi:EVE domain